LTTLPSWLAQTDPYRPPEDRDRFIDKSLRGISSVLGKIKESAATPRPRGSALVRLLFTLEVIVLISVSRNVSFIALGLTAQLIVLSLLPARALWRALSRGLAVGAFALVIGLPAILFSTPPRAILFTVKIFSAALAAMTFSASTPWAELTRALATLRLPGIFILTLDMAIRYLSLLGDLGLGLLTSLRLRSVGKNPDKTKALGGVAGTLFVRSRECAEESLQAMECRGFCGDYRPPREKRTKPAVSDIGLLLTCAFLAAAFFFLGKAS
jgi:cobalt/nickel transport system permease protein